MTYTAKQRGADTCSSPAPRPVVNRTFEGIVLSPEASLSPDTTSNSRPLTRKRRAEISPVIDQPGTGAVVQLKSSKLAHSQLRGFTQPVSKTFGPHDTLAGAASKNTPAAVDDDCTEWWAAYSGCSLDSSAVLQAALTPNAAADCGFQLANVVEAVRTGCKVPLPYSHGLPASLQASAHAAIVTQHIRKHMASQLDDIDNSAVWLRHLEQVRCQTEANPKQGKLAVALDAATPQHTADDAAANPLSLHTALAVPSSRQEDAKRDLDGPHREQSSVLHRHQHCLQGSPAGSYSMHTSGSIRPPWDSSSQGTQSIKRSVSIERPEEACGGHTDSPQAMHRLLASMKQPFVGAAHRSIKKVNADYRSHVEYKRQSGYMQSASDLH